MRIFDRRSATSTQNLGEPVSEQVHPSGDPTHDISIGTTYGFELRMTIFEAEKLAALLREAFEQLETQAEGKEAG